MKFIYYSDVSPCEIEATFIKHGVGKTYFNDNWFKTKGKPVVIYSSRIMYPSKNTPVHFHMRFSEVKIKPEIENLSDLKTFELKPISLVPPVDFIERDRMWRIVNKIYNMVKCLSKEDIVKFGFKTNDGYRAMRFNEKGEVLSFDKPDVAHSNYSFVFVWKAECIIEIYTEKTRSGAKVETTFYEPDSIQDKIDIYFRRYKDLCDVVKIDAGDRPEHQKLGFEKYLEFVKKIQEAVDAYKFKYISQL